MFNTSKFYFMNTYVQFVVDITDLCLQYVPKLYGIDLLCYLDCLEGHFLRINLNSQTFNSTFRCQSEFGQN